MNSPGYFWKRWHPVALLLFPLSILMRVVVFFRRFAYRLRLLPVYHSPVPVIVIGNLTVGGTGKTPLVIRLCEVLGKAGLRPGVVSRGYGRKSTKLRLVSPSSDPSVVGDEPLLIARRTGAPVIVAEDRCEAARRLLQQGVQVVVSDDGLQHYRLPRRIEICVVDGARGFGNGLLLPAGPLREPLERLFEAVHREAQLHVPGQVIETGSEFIEAADGGARGWSEDWV